MQALLQCKCNENYTTCVCICSPRYPACNGHTPCCHLWLLPLFYVFPLYLINDTILEKNYWTLKNVFLVSLQLLSETFSILRITEQDMIKNVYCSSCKSTCYSCHILKKLEFSPKVFEKYSNIKFHENPSSEIPVVACGRTDGQAWWS